MFIGGSMVALVTPFTAAGEVDYVSLRTLLDFQLEAKTAAIVVVGTTGEAATLESPEKQRIIEFTLEHVQGRTKVIAGTSATSTKQTIHNTKLAQSFGVDACLIMTPPYIRPTQEGLYQHYRAIAHEVDIPQILYNVPARTACDLQTSTVARLAKLPHIIGIKDATSDTSRVQALLDCAPGFLVLSGDDVTTLPIMMMGAQGVISVVANIFPEQVRAMCDKVRSGDFAGALAINKRLAPLVQLLGIEANPIPVKWCLQQLGLLGNHLRLPLTPLSQQHESALLKALQTIQGGVAA